MKETTVELVMKLEDDIDAFWEIRNGITKGKFSAQGGDGITWKILEALTEREGQPLLLLFNLSYTDITTCRKSLSFLYLSIQILMPTDEYL